MGFETFPRRPLAFFGAFVACLIFFGHACVQAAKLPPEFVVNGEAKESGEGLTPTGDKPITIEGAISESAPVLMFRARAGKGNAVIIEVELEDVQGQKVTFPIRTEDIKYGNKTYPDARITFGLGPGQWTPWNFRPLPDYYRKEEWDKREAEWAALPGASEQSFTVEFRPSGDETELWVEGQLIYILSIGELSRSKITLKPGVVLEEIRVEPKAKSLVLPVEKYARDGMFKDAQLHFFKNANLPEGFKGMAEEHRKGIDVGGLGTFNQWRSDDLQNFFWRRHATYGFPEQRLFSVPLATYSHAWVLLAVDDASDKVGAFTFRVTRYANSRGDAMADTVVRIPKEENPDARRVGTVSYGPQNGRRESPLWLVRVPIYNGQIQDILYEDDARAGGMWTHRYLDVELLDPLENVDEARAFPPSLKALQRQWKPTDPGMQAYDLYPSAPPATSGVTLYGIQLEKSPVELRVSTNPMMKAFYEADNAEFVAKVHAAKAGDYRVEWKVADVDGRIVDTATQTLKLKAGDNGEVKFPVKKEQGWFAVQTRVLDADGRELVSNPSSYVMLPPDTRKAGYESPFYGWWFGNNHRSPVRLEQSGPLLQRLGIRRAELPEDMPESLTEKYGFTNPSIGWYVRRFFGDFAKGNITLEQAVAKQEEIIRHHLKLWPHTDHMLIFHESGAAGAPFPSELWGEPAQNFAVIQDENSPQALLRKEGGGEAPEAAEKAREQWEQNWPKRMEFLTAQAKMVREKFPNIRMQYGNDGNSLGIVGELFRQKFPRKWIDSIAIEDLGQTIVPENPQPGAIQSAWYLQELARKTGYGDVPIDACTEWINRMTEKLGLRMKAEWSVRDGLLGLAYGFKTITIGGLNDAGDGYYFSIWGNGGITSRWPEMAPKPSYAAIATLTQVLDSAKFVRFFPTGSTVLYAQEFQRGSEWIYAFWTPRGTREMLLEFEKDGKRRSIDLYGREKSVDGKSMRLTAGTAVQYLISGDRLQSLKAGASAFPDDPAPESVKDEILLDTLDAVKVSSEPFWENVSRSQPHQLPKLSQGKFEIREVNDPEMGQCLEVELIPDGERWAMDHEYVVLKLGSPVPTEAKNAGLWIKGNGSWGQINILKTQSWGPWATNGNLNMRWMGGQLLNFDGWNFIRYPYYDWIRDNESNAITGIMISMPRKTIVGTEMQPVEPLKIRLKKIVLF